MSWRCRCVEQDKITELLGVAAGATPLSNNASFHKKKSISQQSSFSTSGEFHSNDSSSGDPPERSLYRKMSSGEIPPAIEPRSEWSRRVQCIIECARQMNSMKPGQLPFPPLPALRRCPSDHYLPAQPCLSRPLLSELKIVWGGEINSSNLDVLRFGVRLVEDSIYGTLLSLSASLELRCDDHLFSAVSGCMSYVDYLCDMHSKISSLLP
jgi:hypothetical protein